MSISKIIVTGDFLRPNNEGNSSQNININWFYYATRHALSRATSLPVERYLFSLSAESLTSKLYRWHRLGMSIDSWANLYFREPDERDIGAMWAHFHGALVVGFELPYFVKKAFSLAGIIFIDVVVHPVRFMDDLIFGFQSNSAQVLRDSSEYTVYEEDIYSQAGLVQAAMSRLPRKSGFRFGAGLFAGQTDDDKVLIRNGKFIDPFGERKSIAVSLSGYPQVLIKPHPYGKIHKSILLISRTMINAKIVEDNFYFLLSHDEVEDVVSFCSSTSIEARYFGKNGKMIFDYPYNFLFGGENIEDHIKSDPFLSVYVSLNAPFYNADFWRKILKSIMPVTGINGRGGFIKPNRFRISLRSFWGFDFVEKVC